MASDGISRVWGQRIDSIRQIREDGGINSRGNFFFFFGWEREKDIDGFQFKMGLINYRHGSCLDPIH